jgi:hypothetical protein
MRKPIDFALVLKLSSFGLFMGVATVFVIPSKIEPVFWLAIFATCAVIIARRVERAFLHGFLTSLANCVWITGAHVLLFQSYLARHSDEAAMMKSMPLPDSPRLMMLMTGPIVGIVSGLVLGTFAFVASRFVKKA